ncbi:MAG: hypothetical protein IPN95_05235 [Bacteroidetes bacterium]|nr:hypothetical protein [Bacteroidota bacterium]
MQLTTNPTTARQTKIWADFVVYTLQRYWWVLIVCMVLGGIQGYQLTLAMPRIYEVRASFLVPAEAAPLEYESLLSRSLITKAIGNDGRFEVTNYVKGNRGQQVEMYDESPFQIRLIAFPEHLKNIPHRIKIFEDRSYEVTFEALKKKATQRGQAGIPLAIGSVQISVTATEFWNADMLNKEYTFAVQSKEALTTRVLQNLKLMYEPSHPNRINLYYKDAHPKLAFDLLDAFIGAYLEQCKSRRKDLLNELKLQLEGEMRVLESKLITADDFDFFSQLSKSSLLIQDSSVVEMLRLQGEVLGMENRLKVLDEFKRGAITAVALLDYLKQDMNPIDDSLRYLLTQNAFAAGAAKDTQGEKIVSLVDSLLELSRLSIANMDSKIKRVNAEYLGSVGIWTDWRRQMPSKEESNPNLNAILLQRYLQAMAELAKIELETRKQFALPNLIDPPYHSPSQNRTNKVRMLAAWIVGMSMLGAFLAFLIAYYKRRIGSIAHLQIISDQSELIQWSVSGNRDILRKQATKLELSLKPEVKLIALIGNASQTQPLAESLAALAFEFGKQVLIINTTVKGEELGWERLALPADTKPGWWFSREAAVFLEEKAATYDRVLLCLESPMVVPEVSAAVRQTHLSYFIIEKNTTKVSDWHNWESYCKDLGIVAKAMFLS